jgi:magnesium-transporting ATPase (P-type)
MVVYTGKETKVSMNSLGSGKMKRSQLEKQIDKYLALIVVAQIIVCSVSTVWSFIWVDDNREASYMPFLRDQSFGKTLLNWLTYLILYNNLVPISLYVSLELVKVQMGSLASRDPKMYRNDPLCDHMPTKVNTSDLPEDLGMIKYIFSDKTGTLSHGP